MYKWNGERKLTKREGECGKRKRKGRREPSIVIFRKGKEREEGESRMSGGARSPDALGGIKKREGDETRELSTGF